MPEICKDCANRNGCPSVFSTDPIFACNGFTYDRPVDNKEMYSYNQNADSQNLLLNSFEERLSKLEKKLEEKEEKDQEELRIQYEIELGEQVEKVKEFLKQVKHLCKYWADLPDKTPLERCEGVAFSIFSQIDGCSSSENLYLSVGENNFTGMLHELFSMIGKENK